MPTYKKQKKARGHSKRANPENLMQQMDLFRIFQEEILPEVQEDLLNGLSADEIAKKYARFAMARNVSIAMTEPDSGKGLAASKDILDRSQGKAVERRKITHEMEDLTDEQLDALLLSRMEEMEDSEDEEESL